MLAPFDMQIAFRQAAQPRGLWSYTSLLSYTQKKEFFGCLARAFVVTYIN